MTDNERAECFNKGSDARIFGLPRSCNPYGQGIMGGSRRGYWFLGYDHADIQWGADVRRRWAYQELPSVRVGA